VARALPLQRCRVKWIEVVGVSQNAIILPVFGLVVVMLLASASIRVVQQYQRGVHFRLGRVIGVRDPGLRLIIPMIDRLLRVSMRIVTMPIQSQGIITRDDVSVDIAAVAYFRVIDARKSAAVIENVNAAIDQIAQTTLRNVVGQHSLDEVLAQTEKINGSIRQILDTTTVEWGVEVTLVELKDIQLPDSMKRAMAREAEAEREKRAKIIAAEGEARAAAALGDASDTMMQHPLALQLRNKPADPGRTRCGEKHHRRVPCPIDERDRRTHRLPDPRVERLEVHPAQRSTRREARPCRDASLTLPRLSVNAVGQNAQLALAGQTPAQPAGDSSLPSRRPGSDVAVLKVEWPYYYRVQPP